MRNSLAMLVCLGLAGAALAQPADHPAQAELLTDVSSVEPAAPLTVGIRLTMQPGWHVYWINPGDSGEATQVKWTLPGGFSVTDVHFPVPLRFEQPGDLDGYGYEGEVLLMARVTPPGDLKPGQTVSIGADVTWLVCEKICIPGEAKLVVDLPVVESAKPANRELFDTWRRRIPVPAEEVGARVSSTGDAGTGEFQLIIDWPGPAPAGVEWFPPPSSELAFSEIGSTSAGSRTTVTFRIRPLAGKLPPQTVPQSVLAYDAGDGIRRGLIVAAFAYPGGTGRTAP